jgi:dTDP-4-dehydrorhamnose 3,5-epimerase
MIFQSTPIPGSFEICLSPFSDERGVFSRLYCEDEFKAAGIRHPALVQVNHSLTREKGTIRGMHFQYPPYAEVKIIRCLKGRVYDVVVDLRKNSPSFLKWHSIELSPESYNMIYIPEGCAHGFQTLEENSELLYFHTAFYNKEKEGGVCYNDPQLAIQWPLPEKGVSGKDRSYPFLDETFGGVMLFTH